MGSTWPSPGPHGGKSGRKGNGSLQNNQTSKGKCVNQHKYSDKKTHGSQARDTADGPLDAAHSGCTNQQRQLQK